MPQITIKPEQLKNLDLSKPVQLVADQGIYLMTFGETAKQNGVAYANGLNPHVDEFDKWWPRKQRVMGSGDDEVISLGVLPHTIRTDESLKISINGNSVSIFQ